MCFTVYRVGCSGDLNTSSTRGVFPLLSSPLSLSFLFVNLSLFRRSELLKKNTSDFGGRRVLVLMSKRTTTSGFALSILPSLYKYHQQIIHYVQFSIYMHISSKYYNITYGIFYRQWDFKKINQHNSFIWVF